MDLAKLIDHTYLKPNCNKADVEQLCEEAIAHNFKAVCVPPIYVQFCAQKLEGQEVKVATVIGYPYGYSTTPSKVAEIQRALDDGADELDVVINNCAVKDENWNYVRNDIDSMTRAAHLRGKVVKIIIETALLSKNEMRKVCEICIESGVNFIKTSTGVLEGATVENITFLRQYLPDEIKIKASGGIRTGAQAEAMIAAGANRIGTSNGINIIQTIQKVVADKSNDTGIEFDF